MNKKNILISALLILSPFISFADEKPAAVASVNGVDISKTQLEHFISKLPNPVPIDRALEELVNIELLVQTAKNEGFMKDPNLQLELQRITSSLIATQYLQQQLLKLNLSVDTIRQRYHKDYLQGIREKEFNANHILVDSEAAAIDIIKRLDQGENFNELAKTLSTGPSGKNGGELGWFQSGDMVEAFAQATQALEVGHYSRVPVKTQFGWHIILLNETRELEPPSFESVSQQISTTIAAEEIGKIMQKLKKSATINIFDQ